MSDTNEQPINPIAAEFDEFRSFHDVENGRWLRPNWAGSHFEFPRGCGYTDEDSGEAVSTTCEEVKAKVDAGLWIDTTPPMPLCLDGPEGCRGKVEYRMSGRSMQGWPRCEKHGIERLDREEEINERYPDSDSPPSWFDESFAGERWNDDY